MYIRLIYQASVCLLFSGATCAQTHWPQASGPQANWKVEGAAPTHWSTVRNENIRWRTPMPESGQSAVTVWGDRAFVTIHQRISTPEERFLGGNIIGYCLDAKTGKVLWTAKLPGTQTMEIAGGFSDATVFSPVTDGEHVWFFNRCGSMACYDFTGNQVWQRVYQMRFRHSARMCEPVLTNGQILNVEVQDKEKGSLITKFVPGTSKTMKAVIPRGIDERTVWTYLHGIDAKTGKVLWREQVGTSIHNNPMISTLADGRTAIVHARGGGHHPLEKPYGLSLSSLAPGEEGKTLWSTALEGYDPPFNNHWNAEEVYGFHNEAHIVLDTTTGKELRRHPLYRSADLWAWAPAKNDWTHQEGIALKTGKKHPMTYQTNIVVGNWHWFLAHNRHLVGRIHTKTGKVEYLEVPAQLEAGKKTSRRHWGKGLKNEPKNAAGFAIGRKGHNGTGFGHISAGSPILVGNHLFFPVVTGTVYVIDSTVQALNPKALIAVNDLGPAGETWTLSSFSFANGNLYMHTMREVICIGTPR